VSRQGYFVLYFQFDLVCLECMQEIMRALLRDANPPLTGTLCLCRGAYLVSW
jgi:hypothetical protein